MTQLFFEMNASDIGVVTSDDSVRVTAALVDHPPVVPAFADRFDARDRSLVISGASPDGTLRAEVVLGSVTK